MRGSLSTCRGGVVIALVVGALLSAGFASGGDRSGPPSRGVDAELLLNLDLLSDERFVDDRRGDPGKRSARSTDEFDLPAWDEHDAKGDEPR
jgi:hypothetical protein